MCHACPRYRSEGVPLRDILPLPTLGGWGGVGEGCSAVAVVVVAVAGAGGVPKLTKNRVFQDSHFGGGGAGGGDGGDDDDDGGTPLPNPTPPPNVGRGKISRKGTASLRQCAQCTLGRPYSRDPINHAGGPYLCMRGDQNQQNTDKTR